MKCFLTVLLGSCLSGLFAQNYPISQGGTISACSGRFFDSGGESGQYTNNENHTITFCATPGQYLRIAFSSFGISAGDSLFIYDGADASAPLQGRYTLTGSPGTVFSSAPGGCLTIVFRSNTSGTFFGWAADIACVEDLPPPVTGNVCDNPRPFCTNTTEAFPNNQSVPSMGQMNCLSTTPNPVWYYLQISQAGNISINISQRNASGTGLDVDFALWGPFTDFSVACADIMDGTPPTPKSCSYSASATETATINNAQVGEIYILLLTNYSNQVGSITFSKGGGAAETDCSILCDISNVRTTPSACVRVGSLFQYTLNGVVRYTGAPDNGTLEISNSCGGSATFSYPFPNDSVTYSFPNLTADSGSCTVTAVFTGNANCTQTRTYIAPPPCDNPCGVTASNNTPVCVGETFSLTATQTNGSALSYAWSGTGGFTSSQQNPANISAPIAGSYIYTVTATITGGDTCTSSTTVVIHAAPTAITVVPTGATCVTLGSLTINGVSQTPAAPPYEFSIDGGAYGNSSSVFPITIDSQTAGSHTISVRNVNGCTYSSSFTISSSSSVSGVVTAQTGTSCLGAMDGSVTVAGSGGTPPYTYAIDGITFQPSGTFTGMTSGAHSVTVRDDAGCTVSVPVNIIAPTAVDVASWGNTDISCFGANDGSITIAGTGGTPPYFYSTGGSSQASGVFSNLSAGNYTVTITDINGCSTSQDFTISEPVPLSVSSVQTGANCGLADGSITVSAMGGTLPYSYSIDNATYQTGSYFTVEADTYTVYVRDVNGCMATITAIVNNLTDLTLSLVSQENVLCHGASTGSLTVQGAGTSNYTYSINGGAYQPSGTFGNLQAGTHVASVRDVSGCIVSLPIIITEPPVLTVNALAYDILCAGDANGSITVTVSGGNPSYSYSWSHDSALSDNVAVNLFAGAYTVLVTDVNNCTVSTTALVSEPTALSLLLSTTTPCYSTLSAVTSLAEGGIPAYQFELIQNGMTVQTNTTGEFNGLAAGFYTVRLIDANNCSVTQSIEVITRQEEIITVSTDTTSCFGSQYTDGAIRISVQGLYAPYLFSIDNGRTYTPDPEFGNLASGVYTVLVRNADGCEIGLTVVVPEPAPATVIIQPGDTILHFDEQLVLNAGIYPYPQSRIVSYQWSPSDGLSCDDCANPTFSSYQKDNEYHLTITYNNGCEATGSITIGVMGEGALYLVNAFSPNGDGNNDVFEVYGKGIKSSKIKVFNRWGEKVYDSMSNPFARWDGTYKGVLQPPMIYTYEVEVEFLNGKTVRKLGSLTLIR